MTSAAAVNARSSEQLAQKGDPSPPLVLGAASCGLPKEVNVAINTRWDSCHAAGYSLAHDSSLQPCSERLSHTRRWGTKDCRGWRWLGRERQVAGARDEWLALRPSKGLAKTQEWESDSHMPTLPGSDKATGWDAQGSDGEEPVVDAASNDVAPRSGISF